MKQGGEFLRPYPGDFLLTLTDMEGKRYKLEDIDNIIYLWIRTLKYSKSFDKKRVLKWFEFMSKLFFYTKKNLHIPDIIICSPTAPFSILPAYYLAKKYRATLVFEVRDIWPLTLIEVGGYSRVNPLVQLMSWFEKFALKKSDIIISNLPDYSEWLRERGVSKEAYWVSNGINLEEVKYIEPLDKRVSEKIPENKFIIGYTGKLGVSNAVSYLIEAARILKEYADIRFVIVGDGQEKEKLKDEAEGLSNVIFIDSIKKSQIQSMLKFFDICYIGLQRKTLFKYGTSPNKLFDYMYSGTPVLHSVNTKNDIVQLADCGISVEAENPDKIAQGILELYKMDENKRKQLGENGEKYVMENFTYKNLAEKYLKIINSNNN
ncbi:MAG: glycosyltransferase family 4 protein [Flexistipes sinusarabici]|uniref:Glycosyltransferase family 4 protein n=1 Tax=Flexistipes sinusarabici TaxID=2352 RepID=A0A5D0MPU7_FLESI|nr:MAG: glycosyltransferase family 4 protein [Flexistipes sinusarabici]